VYQVPLGGARTRIIASLLYLRYSKRRYLKFYRAFNRFAMKCFLHEALMHWGYSARQCIIDNTNLARLRGSGSRAVIVPEMASFADQQFPASLNSSFSLVISTAIIGGASQRHQ
jgi:hypothetical protein